MTRIHFYFAVQRFFAARWKALMPFVAYGLSELAKRGFDLSTPTGWGALATAIAGAILVHTVPNTPKF